MHRILADPLTAAMFESQSFGFLATANPSSGVYYMTLPCRADKILNVAMFAPSKPQLLANDDWDCSDTVEDATIELEGFHPFWRSLFEIANEVECFVIGQRDVLSRQTNGKVVLIGDAAHPMQPMYAQGGALGLEHAAALEVLLSDWSEHDDVEKRLELFNDFRLPRNNVTQIYSNAQMYLRDTVDIDGLVRKFWDGPLLPSNGVVQAEEIQDFFFSYDVYVKARKAMQYKGTAIGMPKGIIKHFGR